MLTDVLSRAPIGLLPVIIFLLVLLYLDSYKLVNFRTILWVILMGAFLPFAGYWINGFAIGLLGWDFSTFSRYAAPVIEEGLEGLRDDLPVQNQPDWFPGGRRHIGVCGWRGLWRGGKFLLFNHGIRRSHRRLGCPRLRNCHHAWWNHGAVWCHGANTQ